MPDVAVALSSVATKSRIIFTRSGKSSTTMRVRRFHRLHLPLRRGQQLGALHHFVDVGRVDGNRRRLEERIDLAQLRDRADHQALADGPVVVAVREQDRVEDFAERRLLEDAVHGAFHVAGTRC